MVKLSGAEQRTAFIAEAMTWLGTPFRDQADVKGGGVDCAMLLVRAAVDTGIVAPFDPRPYPPQWHLHRDEERFLAIVSRLGAEVDRAPMPGDVIVYRVGRCFSHGGIVIAPRQARGEGKTKSHGEPVEPEPVEPEPVEPHVLHAYYKTGHVAISPLHEAELAYLPDGRPRPFKLFDLWAKAPHPHWSG
ncbi:MAG TPA: hypothetical protein VGL35_12040 [Rhizomicrobium sp.]